jgi:hypothetical protein
VGNRDLKHEEKLNEVVMEVERGGMVEREDKRNTEKERPINVGVSTKPNRK